MKKALLFLMSCCLVFVSQATKDVCGFAPVSQIYSVEQYKYSFATMYALATTAMLQSKFAPCKKRALSPTSITQPMKRQISFSQDDTQNNSSFPSLKLRRPISLENQASCAELAALSREKSTSKIFRVHSSFCANLHDCNTPDLGPTPESDGGMRLRSSSTLFDCAVSNEGEDSPVTPEKDGSMRLRSYSNDSTTSRVRSSSSESFAGDFILRSFSVDDQSDKF